MILASATPESEFDPTSLLYQQNWLICAGSTIRAVPALSRSYSIRSCTLAPCAFRVVAQRDGRGVRSADGNSCAIARWLSWAAGAIAAAGRGRRQMTETAETAWSLARIDESDLLRLAELAAQQRLDCSPFAPEVRPLRWSAVVPGAFRAPLCAPVLADPVASVVTHNWVNWKSAIGSLLSYCARFCVEFTALKR